MQKKMKLNLENLQVETFQSTPASEERGTVEALELMDTASCNSLCERSWCYSGPCCSTTGLV